MTGQLLRYVAVGVVNTVLGIAVIVVLNVVFAVPDVAANVAGFVIGACCSYLLNKTFTFGNRKRHREAVPAFVLLIGLCMAANLAVLVFALRFMQLPSLAAQAMAVFCYNMLFFLGSKFVVFRN